MGGKSVKRVVVTGGAGQIAYNLLFRIASGEMLGFDQEIELNILDIPGQEKVLEGIEMEMLDCAFPLLRKVRIGSNPHDIFGDVDYALLVGAKPRSPGMERKDLMMDNAKIFVAQGKALNDVANRDAKVLVVGNPCNTNALIAMSYADKISPKNFHAMTRLDQNRGKAQLASKAGVSIQEIRKMAIWGNHSATQVPDFVHAEIGGKRASEVINDASWFEKDFVQTVQKRGAQVLAARGKSSAASAASAIIDAIKSLVSPTPQGEWFSTAVISDGNPYDIAEGIFFSFPCAAPGDGSWKIVSGLTWNAFLQGKIKGTEKELLEERDAIKQMLP
ncbi:malate dehydrogenase [Simkania negevensis]|uniref:Malate dehydrogenase n=1 Tax=Simkania negevensis TaxID=83561 RepID=A0ABS3ATE6_9BACT|nr:malate dehydrogenase [Simkania negevensis]